ncbi:D-ribose pyranase [Albibacillus kandeliae]|uniref:D-ribose pyranase n=1 Tax=Albibacillus kandeliae TaxID=2174228 RepID=UPI000D69BD9B|nr:D-ribose pyranase [Albibacillus kandeliae]
MKRSALLNSELNHAIASMGHTDLMIVCDAGFPIPSDAWRIDLALARDLPDLKTVLRLISAELIAEKVGYAEDLPERNPILLETVRSIFSDSDHEQVPHDDILGKYAAQAKVIVRTGAFDPWGNVLLWSGVDAPNWFNKPGVKPTDYYAEKLKRS